MRYSRTSRAADGRAQVLPSLMREFLGRVSWTMVPVAFASRIFCVRHGRACPGHPRLELSKVSKTWMRETSPRMTIKLIHPRLRLDVGDLVGERVGVHRPVVDRHLALRVEPGERVLHPVLVVALGVILARMRAAAFGAVGGGMHGHDRLRDQVVELERLDQ